jgi:hypothetical protein
MSKHQKELEKVLAKEQFILDSLESRIIDRVIAVETMKVRFASQKETVEKARSNLNRWVNTPTMTKAQVVKEADKLRVVISDSSDSDNYIVDLCAPKGFAMEDSGEPTQYVREYKDNMTKGMFWSVVCESLYIRECFVADSEYEYKYDETGRMVA